MPSGSALEK